MKKDSPKIQKAIPALDQAEWDFSACLDDEVVPCYYYEYARSSESFCMQFDNLRAAIPPELLGGKYLALENGYRMSLNCPEFPATPWLKIQRELRMQRVFQRFIFIQTSCVPADELQPLRFDPLNGEETIKLEICWMATKEQLQDDFAAWITKMIKQRKLEIQNALEKRSENRVAQSEEGSVAARHQPVKLAKNLLTALSAYRLLGVMPASQAHQVSLKADPTGNHGLYANPASWSRAKYRAAEIIRNFGGSIHLPNEISPQ